MMQGFRRIGFAVPLLLAVGCAPTFAGGGDAAGRIDAISPEAAGATPWTGLAPLREEDEFRFAIVTDRTGEHRAGVFEAAMPKINLVRPEFVVSVGDLIEGYTDDPEVLEAQWSEFEGFVDQLDMPFFYAAGNHDMSNASMARAWRERFGPTYYHFRYRGVLFVVLNSELFGMVHDPSQSLPGPWQQSQQMAFVERVLAEHADARWTFVLVHQPLWDSPRIHPDWLEVERLLGSRGYSVFAGHHHRYTRHVRHDRNYVTLGTTGGMSALRGTFWGEFDHVAFVTVTREGPVIANLLLDGIQAVDVATEADRDFADRLQSAISTEPMLGVGGAFEEGTARFLIRNAGEAPLEVAAHLSPSDQLRPDAHHLRRSVAPGATESVEVWVRGRSVHPYAELQPAHVDWTLRTLDAAGRPVEVELESVIVPERRFPITSSLRPIAVDGDLTEWGALRFLVDAPAEIEGHGEHRGPEDCSFRFDVRYGPEAVYIGVAVRDDSVVASRDLIARAQDHVSVNVDARNDPLRSANQTLEQAIRSGSLADTVTATATLTPARHDPIVGLFVGDPPEGMRAQARRTEQGYSAEVSIPFEDLDAMRGAPWDALRLNITVLDFDAGQPDHSALSWRPSRYGPRAAPGAGTFVRR